MKRVILSSFIALLIIGSIAAGYFYYQRIKVPHSEAISAIPPDAVYILECKNFQPTWQKLSESSYWKELLANEYFHDLSQNFKYLDSVFNNNENTKQFLDNYPLYVSVHNSGQSSFDFLYLVNLPPMKQEAFVNDIVSAFTNGSKVNKRVYNGITIRELTIQNKLFSYAVSKGIFMASFTPTLVEDAISQLKVGKSVAFNTLFKQVYDASGRNVDANLYINYSFLPRLLNAYLSPLPDNSGAGRADHLGSFSSWTGLDLKIKPNGLMLNGFSSTSDSGNFLTIFSKLKPQKAEMIKILPRKTAFFLYLGIDNIDTYLSNYTSYLSRNKIIQPYQENLKKINDAAGIDVQQSMRSWIGNEMGLVISEPSEGDVTDNSYAIFKSKNKSITADALKKLREAGKKKDAETKEENYRDCPIGFIEIPKLLPTVFGTAFDKIEKTFYTYIEDFVVIGNKASSIRKFIDNYRDKKTLEKDAEYNKLTEFLESKTNVYVYVSVPKSVNLLKSFASDGFHKIIEANESHIKKFSALALQYRANGNMFYNNIYLQQAPIKAGGISSLWSTELDTTVSAQPFIVHNHKAKTHEVIVQDDAHTVYLLDSIGDILWKLKLDEPILSDIYQIDAFKNNRLQYMFNTSTALYMIDRNGENVDDYPIKFKHRATNGISVFDYDNKRDYRIYVAGEDNVVRAFQASGKTIEGWKFSQKVGRVSKPVAHSRIEEDDYLLITDDQGKVYILDRKGNIKVELKEELNTVFNNPFVIAEKNNSKNAHWVTTDSSGKVLKLFLNGDVQRGMSQDLSPKHFFDYRDLNGDGEKEYIFLDKKMLQVFNQEGARIFSNSFENDIDIQPQFLTLGNKTKIAVVDRIGKKMFLINDDGRAVKGFPVNGITPFSYLQDNGHTYITVGTDEKSIEMYLIE